MEVRVRIAEHEITREEVEEVLQIIGGIDFSRSSGSPITRGKTNTGRILAIV